MFVADQRAEAFRNLTCRGSTKSDRKPMPAAGGDGMKGAPDGVNTDPSGRSEQGESGGGSYPNGRDGDDDRSGGFPRHGGQSNIGYHGGG